MSPIHIETEERSIVPLAGGEYMSNLQQRVSQINDIDTLISALEATIVFMKDFSGTPLRGSEVACAAMQIYSQRAFQLEGKVGSSRVADIIRRGNIA